MFKLKYLVFMFTVHSMHALTTLHVMLSSDNNPGGMGDPGDLRYCLNTMNQALNNIAPDDYEIVFDFPMTVTLNGILPIINNSPNPVSITIGNPGSTPTVIIDGNSGAYSGLFIPIGNVTIQNMIFQNLAARGGNGGSGISGGGGGMGAGGAIYAPQDFFNDSNPSIILMNVLINSCAAIGGNGGGYIGDSSSATGAEGGGGGGGFSGNGGSIMASGSTGGAGGGGFGGDGGDVTLSTSDPSGGGGGGGGGIGSRANTVTPANLGNGGSDQSAGSDGSCYGPAITAGSGGGGYAGGINAGGGGGGDITGTSPFAGGGGGGSQGGPGQQPQGSVPPGGSALPSGGAGGDGGGGGGGGVVNEMGIANGFDGQAGTGGYGGGGGGGAGVGASDIAYTVKGGAGGVGGGGGGGGVNQAGDPSLVSTPADGGNSSGGGGGGGGGPSNNGGSGDPAPGGTDDGSLGGGAGGAGANTQGSGSGGGGGGGGSGLGGAVFVDTGLNFTIQAFSGVPTTFNTSNNTTQAGIGGVVTSDGGVSGSDGSALGNSIFLRQGSSLTFVAQNTGDLLTLGDGVAFADDGIFFNPPQPSTTNVFVQGNGTVVYNGTTNYQGSISINNANFKVNGQINGAPVNVCRNISFSPQRGTLSGTGTLTGDVFVNSGTISPDVDGTLTLGSLELSPADPVNDVLGSLVHIEINSGGTSLVAVTGSASLAGELQIQLDPSATPGTYVLLTSSGIIGTFDTITFTGPTPVYTLSYLPVGGPTFVQLDFGGYVQPPSSLQGVQKQNNFGFEYELYNQLTWTLSSLPGIAGYRISRDGAHIATVSAFTDSYQDHNRPRGISSVYSVVAFDGNGNMSVPAIVTIP